MLSAVDREDENLEDLMGNIRTKVRRGISLEYRMEKVNGNWE